MSNNDKVKVALHLERSEVAPVDVAKLKAKYTVTTIVHNFPCLLPFGNTVLRVANNGNYTIRCGGFVMKGKYGEVDDIVKAFVKRVNGDVQAVKWEVEKDSFSVES